MRIAVVILPPAFGSQKIRERRDGLAPAYLGRYFQEFRILIHHAVNNRREGFVTREQSVTTCEQIALQQALTIMFAEHFDDATAAIHEIVVRIHRQSELPVRRLENRALADSQRKL